MLGTGKKILIAIISVVVVIFVILPVTMILANPEYFSEESREERKAIEAKQEQREKALPTSDPNHSF